MSLCRLHHLLHLSNCPIGLVHRTCFEKIYKITNASTAHVLLLYYLKEHNPIFGARSPGGSWLLDLQTGCRSLVPRGTTVVMCPTDVIDPSILIISKAVFMMTSSNGNIFRVAGPLCGECTGHWRIRSTRPVTRSFGVLFDLRLE